MIHMSNDAILTPDEPPPAESLGRAIRNRMFQGLLLALPVAITFWIVYWLYTTLRNIVIKPVARLLGAEVGGDEGLLSRTQRFLLSEEFVIQLAAVAVVLVLLYVLGMVVHSRLHRAVDWMLLRVPGVTTIYTAVRNVVNSLQSTADTRRFKRVVLVPFPHPGMRAPAFVTSSCLDVATGKKILCVYVPTTPVPTSGYMLMLPEEEATELSWDLNQTLQAIVSGGISVPPHVEYFQAPR
jgi:uncharacterized membrane protein